MLEGVTAERLADVRSMIPSISASTYLDSAGAGLPPAQVTNAMRSFIEDWSKHGEHWDQWLEEVVELRRLYGQLIGGVRPEVGVVPSVSVGLAAVASSLDLRSRKRVVTSSLNFPTNVVLWQRMRESGLLKEVKVMDATEGMVLLQDWEKAIDDKTAAVAVDYVSWFSGYREKIREIGEIAHRHGAIMLVDAFHGVGVFPIDMKRDGVDAAFGGFYKWLCGPHGAACVWVREDVLPGLEPSYTGWHGINDNVIERLRQNRDVFDVPFPLDSAMPAKDAARFEWGTWACVVVRGAIEAVKFALQNDPDSRFQVIKKRREELMDGLHRLGKKVLTPTEEAAVSGIVTFAQKNHKELVAKLASQRIVVSGRFDHVRVSPHFYNTSEEVQTLLDALSRLPSS
jgi:cysteine desulfurase / selenocysteine lyase